MADQELPTNLIHLPADSLSLIGSYLKPFERGQTRVARPLSIPFSRQTRFAYRITDRKTVRFGKSRRNPIHGMVYTDDYCFFTNPDGSIKPEDIKKYLHYRNNPYNLNDIKGKIRFFFLEHIGGGYFDLPDAWRQGIHIEDLAKFWNEATINFRRTTYGGIDQTYGSREKYLELLTKFFRGLYSEQELLHLFQQQERTLLRTSEINFPGYADVYVEVLSQLLTNIQNSERFRPVLQDPGDALSMRDPTFEKYLLPYFKIIVTHEILIERYAV